MRPRTLSRDLRGDRGTAPYIYIYQCIYTSPAWGQQESTNHFVMDDNQDSPRREYAASSKNMRLLRYEEFSQRLPFVMQNAHRKYGRACREKRSQPAS
jgi:hypothetical protein